jgi:ABC-type sugar transport system substrate-binding protein
LSILPASTLAFSVVFINPGSAKEPYWMSVGQVMQAAAQDLDIQLEVLFAERNPFRMIELARNVAARKQKPDFLILTNESQAALPMMAAAEQAHIPYLLTYNALTSAQRKSIGQPRQHYRFWLGSLIPDNVYAGKITASALFDMANRLPKSKRPYKLIVLAGDKATPASAERLAGLHAILERQPKQRIEVVRTVYGQWERETVREQMDWLLARSPDIDLIWSANDLMAFGAIDSLIAHNLRAGHDVLLSAINNDDEAMKARERGDFSVLAAGHFLTGAYALVMLYDYHNGRDFSDIGLEIRQPLFSLVNQEQAHSYLQRYSGGGYHFGRMDFKQFSRFANPKLSRYRFTFGNMLKQ